MPDNPTVEQLTHQLLEFCRHVAGNCPITALSLSDEEALGPTNGHGAVQALLIIRDFQPRLMSHLCFIEGKNVLVLAVDQWIFERDVDRGFLGEALAGSLIFPYVPLVNGAFLAQQEVILKKRLILELLENLVLGYPELSSRLHLKPEYFMYETILNRVRVFPPMAYEVSSFLFGETSKEKVAPVMGGYLKALKQLEKAGQVRLENGYVMISPKFVRDSKNPRVRLTNLTKNAPRALFTSVFNLVPQLMNFFVQNTETFFQLQPFPWRREFDKRRYIDPQKYVYLPTSQGLVSLADKVSITGYAKAFLKNGDYSKIKVEEFGGVLNDVYLIKAWRGDIEKKILVKRFKDWTSLKWFPLSIWSVGATSFAVLGRSRLERECAISELLVKEGFNVPKVLHVSNNERLIFMEFLEGEDLSNGIKRIASAHDDTDVSVELAAITTVGETYARIHALNVALGDTKPENVMVGRDGKIYLLDFEQASHGGDKAWDVAEFLYFSGHYMPLNGERKAEAIACSFINGYLTAGGSLSVIHHAGVSKYTRVFSIFALPSVLRVMSTRCRKAEARKRD